MFVKFKNCWRYKVRVLVMPGLIWKLSVTNDACTLKALEPVGLHTSGKAKSQMMVRGNRKLLMCMHAFLNKQKGKGLHWGGGGKESESSDQLLLFTRSQSFLPVRRFLWHDCWAQTTVSPTQESWTIKS